MSPDPTGHTDPPSHDPLAEIGDAARAEGIRHAGTGGPRAGRRRVALGLLAGGGLVAAASGAWYAWSHRATDDRPAGHVAQPTPVAPAPRRADLEVLADRLESCLGLTAREVVRRLELGEARWHWTSEPPGTLRGATYIPADGAEWPRVKLFIAEDERLYRRPASPLGWDYEAFLGSRVGGIQYFADGVVLNIGPAVPVQWRIPPSEFDR